MHVLIVEPIHEAGIAWLREAGAAPVLEFEGDDWRDVSDRIRAIIVRGSRVDAELLNELPALEVVGKHGVGFNTIDLAETAARGIRVTNTPEANAVSVAEHAVGLLTALARQLVPAHNAVVGGRWGDRERIRGRTKDLTWSRLGLLGAGRIGRQIGRMLRGGLQCEIGAYDPFVDPAALLSLEAERFATVRALFEWADNVIIAAPLTPETKGIVGLDELRLLGPSGFLVCSSRAGIVEEPVLAEAIKSGLIHGAGLDVFDPEPPRSDNPLFGLEGVVLTPHAGGASPRSREQMSKDVCRHIWSLLNGGTAPLVGGETWLKA